MKEVMTYSITFTGFFVTLRMTALIAEHRTSCGMTILENLNIKPAAHFEHQCPVLGLQMLREE